VDPRAFLSVTSRFADHIVVAEQRSTDESRAICSRFPKVQVIANPTDEFNERDRQLLLLRHARAMVPPPRVVLALDADEILAANAVDPRAGERCSPPAPAPSCASSESICTRRPISACDMTRLTPLGYVDDDVSTRRATCNSVRVPVPDYARRLMLDDIAGAPLFRPAAPPSQQAALVQRARERPRAPVPGVQTRLRYAMQWTSRAGRLEPSRAEWFRGWEDAESTCAPSLRSNTTGTIVEVLRYFQEHGARKFWLDDIWQFDWEACRSTPKRPQHRRRARCPVDTPPRALVGAMRALSALHRILRRVRHG